ncbi:retrovirus-related pol polyprotein from transposon TNT 1-94 [Tanacetum coccineum]
MKKAFRIYNRRTRRIIETIHVDFDELTVMASEHSSSGPALHEMTPVSIIVQYLPNLHLQTLISPEVIAPIHEVVAHEHAVSTGSPSSTTVDQDAPSPSNSPTTQETQTPIISHDVEEDKSMIFNCAHMTIYPQRLQLQLHEQALFCYYDAFLTLFEPKNYKDALTQACWIEAMQEELLEFECLENHGYESCDPVDTPLVEKSKLDRIKKGKLWESCWLSRYTPVAHLVDTTFCYERLVSWSSKGRKRCDISSTVKLNILLWSVVVCLRCPLDEIIPYLTMALDTIKFQCTVNNKSANALCLPTRSKSSRSKHIYIRISLHQGAI